MLDVFLLQSLKTLLLDLRAFRFVGSFQQALAPLEELYLLDTTQN